ncbi:iron chelate uptake ABC transporter family permease subunit [Streptomyces iconiensis]|uniref:Iron chelate uptake ABC transporter family permease subunit n=1 Tax=Streptomyces iconiensis TaxID=1384038 RepID=A0ABT6ZX05_9ACTN|nr:iron chelate uptake ABC transporter family permease subunit [Streptomyces iconiensis]MDJ1133377.1 iron chelate uptake ABC transporter family permease subunit [Streptomyces iconiensis]
MRGTAVTLGLAAAVLAALCGALSYGDVVVPLPDLFATLAGGGNGGTRFVLFDLRIPRALTGLLVGAAFGMSGAVFQTMLRNPLASPDVIGISSGASAAAVVGTMIFGLSGYALSASALGGALLGAALIYALAWRRGVTGYRLVLVGIGVGAVLTSFISYLMTRAKVAEAQQALVWLVGSLNERTWSEVLPLVVAVAVLMPTTLLVARTLRPLELGDETATGLGAHVQWARLGLMGCAVALAGVATAAAGPVAFVAFVAAPIARRLMPARGPALLPAALTGSLIVLVADFVAQHLLGQTQYPVGVVTSVIGAPYLLWLLARTNRVGRGG